MITKTRIENRAYIFKGQKDSHPELKGRICFAVQVNGKCIRGRNGNMLVTFDGKKTVVYSRVLRKVDTMQFTQLSIF